MHKAVFFDRKPGHPMSILKNLRQEKFSSAYLPVGRQAEAGVF